MEKRELKNRVKEALELRGMRQSDLVERTGIGKTSINGWYYQRYQPKQKALALMARALNVSEMWLAGCDVPMERPVEQRMADDIVFLVQELRKNPRLKDLSISICSLNADQLTILESMVAEFRKINQ